MKNMADRQYYGRRGINIEGMCQVLIDYYGQAVEEIMKMAESHRRVVKKTR